MSSRSREQTLGSDNNDQNTSGSQPPSSNFPWDAKMKVTYKNINLGFFKYEKNTKRAIDKKCKAFSLEEYQQNY